MLIDWNYEKTYEWFLTAGNYTGYYKKLAEYLREIIPDGADMADLGCGMAQTDFELQAHMKHITCVDLSSEVLEWVDKEIERRDVRNMTPLNTDTGILKGHWDVVTAVYYGTFEDIAGRFLDMADQALIVVTHGRGAHGCYAGTEHSQQVNTATLEACLKQKGLQFELREHELEFGQPLRNLEDGEDYVKRYMPAVRPEDIRKYLEDHLRTIDFGEYRYYLPKLKKFGIFVIRKNTAD